MVTHINIPQLVWFDSLLTCIANPLFESTWSLKAHATDVLSGKQQSNAGRIQSQQAKNAANKRKTKIAAEPQGPVDWSIR